MRNGQFFRHDVSATSSPKLMVLLQKAGVKGYGVYWVVLEALRMQADFRLPLSMLGLLARQARTRSTFVERVILEFDLFVVEDDFFYSPGMNRRMQSFVDKRSTNTEQMQPVVGASILKVSKVYPYSARKEEKRKEKENNNSSNNAVATAIVADRGWGEGLGVSPLPAARSWEDLVDEMSTCQEWMDLTGLHSGLGELYVKHQPLVLELFKDHIRRRDKGGSLLTLHDVKEYYANCLTLGSWTCRTVREQLVQQLARQQQIGQVSPYETQVDGQRMYLGRVIPEDAPPRPNAHAIWDEAKEKWTH